MAKINLDVAMESTSQEILGKVANGVVPQSRSPIAIYKNNDGREFSGTGKGVLFIGGSNNLNVSVTVDGVELISGLDLTGSGAVFFVEFTQSFMVAFDRSDNSRDVYAVFY